MIGPSPDVYCETCDVFDIGGPFERKLTDLIAWARGEHVPAKEG